MATLALEETRAEVKRPAGWERLAAANFSMAAELRRSMLDTQQTHAMSDFLQNPERHVARLKETRMPEVLTVNGRAEVVLLDTETYESMVEQLNHVEAVAAVRAVLREARCAGPTEEISAAEMERREAVMQELVEETERLGLYR